MIEQLMATASEADLDQMRVLASLPSNMLVVCACLVLAALWGAYSVWGRFYGPRHRHHRSSGSLFAELCAAHRLSQAERQLLAQATQPAQIREHELIFVDQQLLAGLANQQSPEAAAFAELRLKLFDETH